MALQYGLAIRGEQISEIEVIIGAAPTLNIYNGAVPANLAAAPAGSILISIALPTSWLDYSPSNPTTTKVGTWSGTASATGTMTFFRILAGGVAYMQGTVGTSGTDMIVSSTAITSGQAFTVLTFSLTQGNA